MQRVNVHLRGHFRLGGIGLLALGLSVAACSRKLLNDSPPQSQPLRIEEGCFDAAIATMHAFYRGTATDVDVNAAWDCGDRAIASYIKYVPRDAPDAYTPISIREFFFKNRLVGSARMSDALLEQIVKLKRVFLGGSSDLVTSSELERARAAFRILKAESLKLLPHMRILSLQDDGEKASLQQVDEAARQIVRSGQAIGALLGSAQGAYAFADAQSLIEEIAKIYERGNKWDGPRWLAARLGYAKTFKVFLIKEPADRIDASEWPSAVEASARMMAAYLRFRHGVEGREMMKGEGLAGLVATMNEGFDLLDMAVDEKPEGAIPWTAIDGAFDFLYQSEAIRIPLSKETMKDTARTLVERVFNWRESAESGHRGPPLCDTNAAEKSDRCEPSRGLTGDAARQMRADFLGWADMQRLWDEVEAKTNGVGADGPVALRAAQAIWPALETDRIDDKEEAGALLGLSGEHGGRTPKRRPLAYAARGTVRFDRDVEALSIDRASFASLNWKRLVARAAVRGFAANPIAARWSGIDKNEFRAVFAAFRPLAVELRLIAPNDDRSWNSSFEESDLFMFSSNGDGRMNWDEGVDLISFALSGSKMSKVAYADMRESCRNFGPDDFNLPKIDQTCFLGRLRGKFGEYYAPIPGWTDYVAKLNAVEWQTLATDLLRASRMRGDRSSELESSVVDHMTMLLEYVESAMRFDINGDGLIDADESEAFYPLLSRMLEAASKGSLSDRTPRFSLTSPSQMVKWASGLTTKDLFQYLLSYGAPPAKDEDLLAWKARRGAVAGAFEFMHRGKSQDPPISADRAKLIKIIANMKDADP